MYWMSVKLPDNFRMREHSWPCRFHIILNIIRNFKTPLEKQNISFSLTLVSEKYYFKNLTDLIVKS